MGFYETLRNQALNFLSMTDYILKLTQFKMVTSADQFCKHKITEFYTTHTECKKETHKILTHKKERKKTHTH